MFQIHIHQTLSIIQFWCKTSIPWNTDFQMLSSLECKQIHVHSISGLVCTMFYHTCSYLCKLHVDLSDRDWRDSRKSLGIDNFCSVSVGLGLDNPKFSSLKESQSRQLTNSGSQIISVSTTLNFWVSKSLGLTTFNFIFRKHCSFYGWRIF